jgi:cytochrome c-type biogenesis protein CcmF
MIPELGLFALIVALAVALLLGTLPLIGAQRGIVAWMALARPAALAQLLCVGVSFVCLMTVFATHDFSVELAAQHSNRALPTAYRLAATWGSHEGSMLLWILMLTGWTAAVALRSAHLPLAMVARVLGVMGLLSVGFLLFILFTSNPFARLPEPALDGRDLNPLLQDPGMVFHPPLLYMGYVGFAVAFAFAIAALLAGRLDATWARWSRPWTTAAWMFLTLGIALGSYWAYYELGWGGWWFWDPVENASFMPWLVGTALIHSLAVAEKRGAFKAWTVLLAIAAFSLSLLGTFLVRSGVLTSVHAFAVDPARGVFILAFLVIVVGGSLALYGWRASSIGLGGGFERSSRESLLLANNVLLAVTCGAVMLGTLYPLAIDAFTGGKLSVGPPYFDAVFAPLMAPLVLLMAVGPLARWKSAPVADIARALRWPALAAVLAAAAIPVAAGRWSFGIAVGVFLATWVIAASVVLLLQQTRHGGIAALARAPLHFWGMWLAHLGIAVFVIGVTMVKGYEVQRDVRLTVGEGVEVGGWRFTFAGVEEVAGPNYGALRGRFSVVRPGVEPFEMAPEKRIYRVQQNPMTEAAIDHGVTRDIYVALGESIDATTWTVRIHLKPFVAWIWGGAVLMALGGLLALSDRRYRLAAQRAATRTTVAAAS